MTNQHAAQFLLEMKADIEEIKKIVSAPIETAELNTENARRRAELEKAIEEALHLLNDINMRYSARVAAVITTLEVVLDDDIPF